MDVCVCVSEVRMCLFQFAWCKQVNLDPLEVLPALFTQSLDSISLGQLINVTVQDKTVSNAPVTLLDLKLVCILR